MFVIDFLNNVLLATWYITLDMSPYLLFGFLCAGFLHNAFSQNMVLRHLSQPNFSSVLKASVIGMPLPLCSCGVIPVASHIHKQGASSGASISFLTSTPNTGVDSIVVTYGMLGPIWAIIRPITAIFSGIFCGAIVNYFRKQKTQENSPVQQQQEKKDKRGILRYAFVDAVRDIAMWLVIGIIIGGVISVALPSSFIEKYLSSPFVSYLAVMLIGLPMYVCSTASIPIAVALISKGLSPGAALVFLIVGPATNSATISYVWGKMGKKVFAAYMLSIVLTSVFFGVMLDQLWPTIGTAIPHMGHNHDRMLPYYVELSSAILLIVFIINAYIPKKSTSNTQGGCCKKTAPEPVQKSCCSKA